MKQIITTRIATRPAKRILIIMSMPRGCWCSGKSRGFLPRPTLLGAKEQAYEAYYWRLAADYPDDTATRWGHCEGRTRMRRTGSSRKPTRCGKFRCPRTWEDTQAVMIPESCARRSTIGLP